MTTQLPAHSTAASTRQERDRHAALAHAMTHAEYMNMYDPAAVVAAAETYYDFLSKQDLVPSPYLQRGTTWVQNDTTAAAAAAKDAATGGGYTTSAGLNPAVQRDSTTTGGAGMRE